MAPQMKRHSAAPHRSTSPSEKRLRVDASVAAEDVLRRKKSANQVFDILELLESEEEEEHVLSAICACKKLFWGLLERKQLYRGAPPAEEEAMSDGTLSADEKYSIFMRHRYSGCVEMLLDHLDHPRHTIRKYGECDRGERRWMESALCCLMEFAAVEGQHPLQDLDWTEHYSFPRQLILALVERLLSTTRDTSLLNSAFQHFLDMEDVRYYVMSAVRENVATVMTRNRGAVMPVYQNNVFGLMSNISVPSKESELVNFLVRREAKYEDWKAAKLGEHKRAFEKMWLVFLKYQLPSNLYKKVLVILHDSVLPHMSNPTLLLDFLSAAYDVGGAISLLALNGLFVLIHQHNLDFPNFYQKLYNLLEPSVLHAKYRARFFHLADLFLSSSHLPAYLVAAFAKRLARLALTAPPTALLIMLPFIYNLLRRHPSCRLLLHKPGMEDGPVDDMYLMDQDDPAQCQALDSSLWEIKTLQKHHHPDVAKAATLISSPLHQQEEDLRGSLEATTYELMEKDLQEEVRSVPLEFEPAQRVLQGEDGVLERHFCLSVSGTL